MAHNHHRYAGEYNEVLQPELTAVLCAEWFVQTVTASRNWGRHAG